jgi:hypothetical protein
VYLRNAAAAGCLAAAQSLSCCSCLVDTAGKQTAASKQLSRYRRHLLLLELLLLLDQLPLLRMLQLLLSLVVPVLQLMLLLIRQQWLAAEAAAYRAAC